MENSYNKVIFNKDYEGCMASIENKFLIQIVKETDEAAMHQIRKYCKEKGITPYIISAEKIDLIIKLGIERYNEIYKEE